MGLIVEAKIKNKKILDRPSLYNPSKEVRERMKDLQKEFELAERIRNQSYEEFNDRTVIEYKNDCERAFNSYTPPQSSDPDYSWRSNAIRPITRNKCISVAAHVTSTLLFPNVFAQNDNDEEDKKLASIMRDLLDYSLIESKYERFYVNCAISCLFNPVVIAYETYNSIKRPIKRLNADGTWEDDEMEDDEYNGFYNEIVPVDEFYIGNVYQARIQRQPFIIWRRVIDYTEAKIEFGHLENFKKYVTPGLRIFYVDEQDSFYEQYDDEMEERLVEVITYYNKYADLELRIINGVLMDDPDRPMQRDDKNYPFAKLGYEPVDEGRFFYYKSLVDKISPDQSVIDVLYRMIIDGTFLEIMPPIVSYGDEHVDSGVVIPGMMLQMQQGSKLEMMNRTSNLNAGMNTLQKVEASVSESSTDPLQGGQSSPGAQTAFEISRLEANAKTVLGLYGKQLKYFVEDLGNLRLKTILQYLTVAQSMEQMGKNTRLLYNEIIVPERKEIKRNETHKIRFDFDLNEPKTEDERLEEGFGLMKEEDKINKRSNTKTRLFKVNPTLFRKMKYKAYIDADFKFGESEAAKKALNLEAYDRLIQNPMIDQTSVTKDFLLSSYKPGDEEKYIKKEQEAPPGKGGPGGGAEMAPGQPQEAQPGMQLSGALGELAKGGEQPGSPEQLAL